jgi:hypothetical protein
MKTFRNPFRARASEQFGDTLSFLRNFGAGVLELVPESIWDRPLILQSAPGGGKTSLMRLFAIDSLEHVHRRRTDFGDLVTYLEELGALAPTGPTHLGIMIGLDKDFRSLLDLRISSEEASALFFRLLDARIMQAIVRAALAAAHADDPAALTLVPLRPLDEVAPIAELVGGVHGDAILAWARANERLVLRPLDSLLPMKVEVEGQALLPLTSLRLLSLVRFRVGDVELPHRPLIMLDDGHELGHEQRRALLARLPDRTLEVARWYSERFEALENEELMVGNILGRDFELLQLENGARHGKIRLGKVMLDVADKRARPTLFDYADIEQSFRELVAVDGDDLLAGRTDDVLRSLHGRVQNLAAGHERYVHWLEAVDEASGYDAAVLLRTLEIVVRKDLGRTQTEIFEMPLPVEEFDAQRPRVVQAARLFLSREFGLPFYCGPAVLASLGSENMEQFLRLAGDLFEQVLAEITLRRLPPRLDAIAQDRTVRRASERYWRELPARVRDGRSVRRLVSAIVQLAQDETFRETAPYSPGVTGTAMLMSDRERLLDRNQRAATPGADLLLRAMGSAIASNVLSVELDYSVKNQRVMVIYLNRLFCPRFQLPLGRGGFRERKLEAMASWMIGERASEDDETLQVYEAEQLTL